MGDVNLSGDNKYKTYEAMGTGETSVGSNSYVSGSLSTNLGSYNIITTKYGDYEKTGNGFVDAVLAGLNKPYAAQNTGSIVVGTLNSIQSNSSTDITSGVANSVIGMVNKTQNSNGSLIFGTGNEITNSIDEIPVDPNSIKGNNVSGVADSFRDAVSDRDNKNGGAVLAIGGGNKADYAQNSQLIGVQNEITGTSRDISKFNMINGYQNTITNGSNDTVIGTKNTVTNGDSNVVLGDNHTVQDANNNVILGSSDKETTHTASDTVVIGHNAQANGNNDVAIGSGSVANGAVKTAGYAGANPIGTVSVGSEGNERTITNVAAGRIDATSTDAVNGSQLYDVQQEAGKHTTIQETGKNVTVKTNGTTDGHLDYTVDLNDDVTLDGNIEDSNKINLSGTEGTIDVVKANGSTNINGGIITVSSGTGEGSKAIKIDGTTAEITGLSNTTLGDGSEDSTFAKVGRAATEEQLQAAMTKIDEGSYKGWNVSAEGGKASSVASGKTVDFSGAEDEDGNSNITVTKTTGEDGNTQLAFGLSDDLNVTNITANNMYVTNTDGTKDNSVVNVGYFNANERHIMPTTGGGSYAATEDGTVTLNYADGEGNLIEGTTAKITGLASDKELSDAAAAAKTEVTGGKNITVGEPTTASDGHSIYTVDLADNVYLGGDNTPENSNITLDGTNGVIGLGSTIALDGRDGTAVIGGVNITTTSEEETGKAVSTITGLSNTTWEGTTETPDRAATEGQLQSVATEAAKHTTVSGDENITVKHEEGSQDYQVTLNPDVTLKGDNSSIELTGTKGTIQVNQETAEGTDFTNINGNVVSVGYTNSEGTKNAIVIDGGEGTITGLSNTTWDDELAKQVANSEELQGTAATQGQLQQATSTLTTNERHIATNGGDNPEAPNNKYTVQADGKVSLTEVNGDGTPTKNTVVLDNVATKTQQDINTDKLTHIEHYAGNTEGKDYTQVEGTKLYNDGSISSTVKDGLGMSSDTLTFDESGLTVSKETMGNGSGSTNISGDTIKTVDESGNETTIDGGSVTTEDLTVNTENGNKLTFDSTGLNVNSGDTGLSVNKDGISLSVDNGAGKNSSVKVTQDGTEFSYSENGIADATTTTIKGSTITTDTVTGLNNTKWDDVTKQSVADDTDRTGAASMAATQGQLADAIKQAGDSAAANDYRLVQNGTTADGKEVPYEINGNDQVELKVANSLGDDYTVTIDDVAKASELDTLTSQVDSGWTAKDSEGNVVEVNKENGHILNFYGDENINVTADKGAINIGLNPIVTLGDKNGSYIQLNSQPTDDDAMLTIVGPKDPVTGTHGEFAVGQDGTVHSTGDVIAYAGDDRLNGGEGYSLGDIGDTVSHMAQTQEITLNGETHQYTVFGNFETEDDKANPFDNDISLVIREDGAVAIGAYKDKETGNVVGGIRLNEDKSGTITGLANTEWSAETGADDTTAKTAATQGQLNDLYNAVVSYDIGSNYGTVTLKGADYDSDTHKGGTVITNVAYSSGNGSDAVNVDYLNDAIADAVSDTGEGGQGGIIANSDKHLVANTAEGSNGVYKPDDKGNVDLIVADKNGNKETVTIGDVASKTELDNVQSQVNKNTSDIAGIKEDIGDLNYSNAVGTDVKDGDSVTDAIGKLDNKIDSIGGTATEADNNTVTGGTIKDDGTISLTQKDGGTVDFDKKVSDAYVSDAKFENNTLTISQTDKYGNDTYKDITVKNIASTDDVKKVETDYKAADKNITDTIGATSKEELSTIYKDADKEGNTTTQYINESENMAQADVALDHAIQNVANTSYANDMYLNNRIDNVESRLGDVEERIDKVGAMAAAIANLRTMGFDPEAPTEIAIGVGQYKSETGIAIGVFHYPNQDFMLSASLSSSGDELMGGIGATWKLGRKSAAERAKDEEARHLEQAEEMKKLAQQEKVKAQAQRHAKLLAERQQASQKNA